MRSIYEMRSGIAFWEPGWCVIMAMSVFKHWDFEWLLEDLYVAVELVWRMENHGVVRGSDL
jgi:hypothetical protein